MNIVAQAAYNCSKAAVVKLTETLGCEWIDRGVNVNCISPGIVATPLIFESPALKPLVETWLQQIPAGRLAEVTDLQAAVVFLASDASSYMVGHNLAICGGQVRATLYFFDASLRRISGREPAVSPDHTPDVHHTNLGLPT